MSATAIPPADLKRLVHILGMLGSNFDGERAAAAKKADELVKRYCLTWEQVIIPALPRPEKATPREESRPDWQRRAWLCLADTELLTQWEFEFCDDMASRHREPSEKQNAVLNRIYEKVRRSRGAP